MATGQAPRECARMSASVPGSILYRGAALIAALANVGGCVEIRQGGLDDRVRPCRKERQAEAIDLGLLIVCFGRGRGIFELDERPHSLKVAEEYVTKFVCERVKATGAGYPDSRRRRIAYRSLPHTTMACIAFARRGKTRRCTTGMPTPRR